MNSATRSNSLSLSPPEVLSEIIRHLKAHYIGNLYLSGDKNLIRNMTERGGVKNFELILRNPKFGTMPPMVYQMAGLEVLDVERTTDYYSATIGGIDMAKLPKSLRKIRFDFCDCLPLLLEIPDDESLEVLPKNLATWFPNLQELDYSAWHADTVPYTWLPFFPPTLTTLDLERRFLGSNIHLLPRQLLNLHFREFQNDIDWKEDPEFPPYLEKLVLSDCSSCRIYKHLPHTMTELEVDFSDGTGWYAYDKENVQGWTFLPPKLVSLNVWADESPVMTEAMMALVPRSVTSLWVSVGEFNSSSPDFQASLASLPANMKRVDFYQGSRQLHHPDTDIQAFSEVMRKMPKTLTSCDRSLSNAFATALWFPSSLTRLNLKQLSPDLCAILPPTLVTLSCNKLEAENEPVLSVHEPDKVHEYLRMLRQLSREAGFETQAEESTKPPFSGWPFPKNLTSVSVWGEITLPALYGICQLKKLTSIWSPHTMFISRYLQPEITDIRLETEFDPDSPIFIELGPEFTKHVNITHFTNLEYLSILKQTTFNMVEAILDQAPKCLRSLDIRTREVPLSANVLSLINPVTFPLLEHLSVYELKDLENHHLDNLPPFLVEVTIEGSTGPSYTNDCISRFPRTVSHIRLPISTDLSFDISHLPCLLDMCIIDPTAEDEEQYKSVPACEAAIAAREAEKIRKYRGWF